MIVMVKHLETKSHEEGRKEMKALWLWEECILKCHGGCLQIFEGLPCERGSKHLLCGSKWQSQAQPSGGTYREQISAQEPFLTQPSNGRRAFKEKLGNVCQGRYGGHSCLEQASGLDLRFCAHQSHLGLFLKIHMPGPSPDLSKQNLRGRDRQCENYKPGNKSVRRFTQILKRRNTDG